MSYGENKRNCELQQLSHRQDHALHLAPAKLGAIPDDKRLSLAPVSAAGLAVRPGK